MKAVVFGRTLGRCWHSASDRAQVSVAHKALVASKVSSGSCEERIAPTLPKMEILSGRSIGKIPGRRDIRTNLTGAHLVTSLSFD